ncbi:DEAD/DEAH box helicase [Jeotgalibacillus haloalkalitolerans]|uniref:DEAD/DEAH box helicase n=1 Tax=Jeotgalibacillus haloalkalitolerans TaxID=3104292 RepID=A0ABU5KL43_9BACL|nr:DEAD/DEAH box helicase [Jeotgalibacillus sp. HH7-29]MDZ5711466.1 DEAD/DEAH box helicase [Jeotgalibacillus sp. HH7-29]
MTTPQQFLSGRQFLLSEVIQLFPLSQIENQVECIPAVEKYVCNRCGNKKRHLFAAHPCGKCGQQCTYCRNCIQMGKTSECERVVLWKGAPYKPSPPPEPVLQWEGELSLPQQRASDALVTSIDTKKSILVHAVCGAGKTEILFHMIETALQKGLRICIATPRRDVVQELAPRLKRAFPTADIESLYGGSEDRLPHAHLTIATTHQLIRFREAFDVMVIDEVDAFPFSADDALQNTSQLARKKSSTLIYLSATPSRKIKTDQIIKIPARFHGFPLPVPETKWLGNWRKGLLKKRVDPALLKWLSVHPKVLVFMPDIESMQAYAGLLDVPSVHSADPDRGEKVMAFREGKCELLLTTTILERGVTFSGVEVAVVGAGDPVFTEAALVQIAGRVGRDPLKPKGNVTFFHNGLTDAMVKAQRHIVLMNKEAAKLGYVKGFLV